MSRWRWTLRLLPTGWLHYKQYSNDQFDLVVFTLHSVVVYILKHFKLIQLIPVSWELISGHKTCKIHFHIFWPTETYRNLNEVNYHSNTNIFRMTLFLCAWSSF